MDARILPNSRYDEAGLDPFLPSTKWWSRGAFVLLLSLLPATAAAIGLVVLDQRPAWREPAVRTFD
jgi:hypothetical protein